MQKHQQWLDNRTYEQHLMCLTKIKENFRKKNIKSAVTHRRRRASQKQQSKQKSRDFMKDKDIQNETPHQTHSHTKNNADTSNSKSKITYKQKQLLWNNFMLGKRIMEASPVICTRKQEDEYKKHKKMVNWRIQRNKKLALNTDFRQTKLKEYTENTHRLSNTHRLQTSVRTRLILSLKIHSIITYRPSHNLEDIVIKMRIENKKSVQVSQIINIQHIGMHEFYFKYFHAKPDHKEKQNIIYTTVAYRQNKIRSEYNKHNKSPSYGDINDNQLKQSFVNANNINKKINVIKSSNNSILFDIYQVKGLQERHIGGWAVDRNSIALNAGERKGQMRKTGKVIGEVCFQVFVDRKNHFKQTL